MTTSISIRLDDNFNLNKAKNDDLDLNKIESNNLFTLDFNKAKIETSISIRSNHTIYSRRTSTRQKQFIKLDLNKASRTKSIGPQ